MHHLRSKQPARDDSEFERLLQLAAALYGAQGRTAARSGPRPAHGEIARRAYLLYLERGKRNGRDLEDWLAAERELRAGRAKA